MKRKCNSLNNSGGGPAATKVQGASNASVGETLMSHCSVASPEWIFQYRDT